MKTASPLIENSLAVGKESPEKRSDLRVSMFRESQRHGEGQRESVGGVSPLFGVGERQLSIAPLADEADRLAVNEGDQFLGHGFFCRRLARSESRLTVLFL